MTERTGPNFEELKVLPDLEKVDELIAMPIKRSKKFESNTHQLISELDLKRDEAKLRILDDIKDRQQLKLIPVVVDALQYIEDTERIDKFFFQLAEIYVDIIDEMLEVSKNEYVGKGEYRRLLKKYEMQLGNAVKDDAKGNKQVEVLQKIKERIEKEIDEGATIGRITGLRLGMIRQIQTDESIPLEEKRAVCDAVSRLITQYLKQIREDDVEKTQADIQASNPDKLQ